MVQFGSGGEAMFVALIGDVVRSRSSRDRRELQQGLLAEVERLNDRLGEAFASPLALTAGDEVEALFVLPEGAVAVAVGLSEAIAPDRLIYGLGRGGISTDLHPDVARIDGPCFHRARTALAQARGGRWMVARGFGRTEDRLLTALFTLMGALRSRWTARQLTYARAARTEAQKDVARRLGVAPSTVSESLKASAFAAVREGEEAARRLLREFGSKTESKSDAGEDPN